MKGIPNPSRKRGLNWSTIQRGEAFLLFSLSNVKPIDNETKTNSKPFRPQNIGLPQRVWYSVPLETIPDHEWQESPPPRSTGRGGLLPLGAVPYVRRGLRLVAGKKFKRDGKKIQMCLEKDLIVEVRISQTNTLKQCSTKGTRSLL